MRARVSRPPWRWREAARYAWPAYAAVAAALTVGTFLTWQNWRQARSAWEALEAAMPPSPLADATGGEAPPCDATGVRRPTLPLPAPAIVLADLRRAPGAAAAAVVDLRFERVLAPGAAEQLHVSGSLQGPYAAGKEALKSVLDRYPGAALTSLRLQRVPSSSDVQWSFSLQFWALPLDDSGATPCSGLPTADTPVAHKASS